MEKVHVYLNFNGTCEEAFNFYAKVFNSPLHCVMRYADMPPHPDMPPIPEKAKNKVMHTQLQLSEQSLLMGSDIEEAYGQKLTQGNSTYVTLATSSEEETHTLYKALTTEAKSIEMELGEQFWADLYASFQDKFGIWWMLIFEGSKAEQA
jgi:PhnB protein